MGSYTSIEAGFEISIPDIDRALGQITKHPGRDAVVTTVDRYDPKTGAKKQKTSKVPAIPSFQRVTIEYDGQLYVDRLTTDGWKGYIQGKNQDEAWQLLGATPLLEQKDGVNDQYSDLMERLSFDLDFELTWAQWGHFIFTDRSFSQPGSRDFTPLSYYDDPAIRTKISDLQARLEGVGFQNLEFGFIPLFHE